MYEASDALFAVGQRVYWMLLVAIHSNHAAIALLFFAQPIFERFHNDKHLIRK